MAITFVGNATPVAVDNGGTCTIDLTTISGLAQDDVVICGFGSNGGSITTPSGGWNTVSTGSINTLLGVYYKFMGASPDTSVVGWDVGGSTDAGTACALALRGVDQATPLDGVTPTQSQAAGVPNPSSIVPASDDCAVVVFTHAEVNDTTRGSITNYSNITGTSISETGASSSMGTAVRILTGGAGATEDPASWSSWTSSTYRSSTSVWRPLVAGQPYDLYEGGVPYVGSRRYFIGWSPHIF